MGTGESCCHCMLRGQMMNMQRSLPQAVHTQLKLTSMHLCGFCACGRGVWVRQQVEEEEEQQILPKSAGSRARPASIIIWASWCVGLCMVDEGLPASGKGSEGLVKGNFKGMKGKAGTGERQVQRHERQQRSLVHHCACLRAGCLQLERGVRDW